MGPPMGTPMECDGLVKGPNQSKATSKGKKGKKLNSGLTPDLAHLGILDPESSGKLFSPNIAPHLFSPATGPMDGPSPVRFTPAAGLGRTPFGSHSKGGTGFTHPMGFTPAQVTTSSCISVHTYINTYIHTHIYIYIYIYSHIFIHTLIQGADQTSFTPFSDISINSELNLSPSYFESPHLNGNTHLRQITIHMFFMSFIRTFIPLFFTIHL